MHQDKRIFYVHNQKGCKDTIKVHMATKKEHLNLMTDKKMLSSNQRSNIR